MTALASRFSLVVGSLFQRAGTYALGIGSNFHSLAAESTALPNPGGLFNLAVRYNIRNHFPRPCERKRIKRHGWNKRMSTAAGQRVLMRRILRGKHVYSH